MSDRGRLDAAAARTFEASGDLEKALKAYVKLDLLAEAARVAWALQRPAEAAELSMRARRFFEAGQCFAAAADPARALACFVRVAPDDENYRVACTHAIAACATLGRLDPRVESFIAPWRAHAPAGPFEEEALAFLARLDVPEVAVVDVAARLERGKVLAERFVVGEVLVDAGAYLLVAAHDRRLGVDVALKAQRRGADAPERLRRESAFARKVAHANLPNAIDLSHDGHLVFLVLDLPAGASLTTLRAERRVPALGAAFRIAAQVVAGLAAAHAAGGAHGALTTDGVFVTRGEQALVLGVDALDAPLAARVDADVREVARIAATLLADAFDAVDLAPPAGIDELRAIADDGGTLAVVERLVAFARPRG